MHAIVNPLIAQTISCYSSLAHARDSGLVYPPINFLFTANELFVYCRYPVSDAAVVASLRSLDSPSLRERPGYAARQASLLRSSDHLTV